MHNDVFDNDISMGKLKQRYNNKCYLCGVECNDNDYTIDDDGNYTMGNTYPTIDHIVPLYRNGTHTWDNVALCCKYCNSKKGTKDYKAV